MYRVIEGFTDLQDDNHAYSVGDTFPRDGMKVSADRLKELSSANNKRGKALIEPVEQHFDFEKAPAEAEQEEQHKKSKRS